MHVEVVSPPPTMSVMIELGEAQRLSDLTVQEWFARRARTSDASPTLVEEVDKRLVMMVARKKLAESPRALTEACVADAVAHATFAHAI
jgi:short-subunit dehydrogenase